MLIRKKHIIRHYTIVEVMVAMGIFLIMMTIMMQFFTSAQKVWNLASKKNMMYADARVAMNLMTREIQSMLYSNDETDGSEYYPFWFEWTTKNIDLGGETTLLTDADNYNLSYLTALNFLANTDIKPIDKGSDVCEIRYQFVPVYISSGEVKGGKLQRSCVAEWETDILEDVDWDFDQYPNALPPTANRVNLIWENTDFITVISGVYSLRFTCYMWSSGLKLIKPLDASDNLKNNGGFAASGALATGSVVPVAVRIDMKLMGPKDLKKLAVAINNSDTKQIKILKQKMRTFSKVIYLGKRED